MKIPELLAPAGDMEKLRMAFAYGADAVYLGGKNFGLRAFSENFDAEELQQAFSYAHALSRKVYVTVNAFCHHDDLEGLPDYLQQLEKMGCDAILVSDPGVVALARECVPELPIHLSTQANTVNWMSAKFWQQQGVERIVLARELSLREIKAIRDRVDVELESFVHGAMCISYSGRCLLSGYMTGRLANRGECTQPCRWKYALVEETRPGEYFPVSEDERGTYIMNSRDLCLIRRLPELCGAGIDSLKIEGRMKSVHYVATVVRVYRAALDLMKANKEGYAVSQEWMDELDLVSGRGYTEAFIDGLPGPDSQRYEKDRGAVEWDFSGIVQEWDAQRSLAWVQQRNSMKLGDTIELVRPGADSFRQKIDYLLDESGQNIEKVLHPCQTFAIRLDQPANKFSLLRRKI